MPHRVPAREDIRARRWAEAADGVAALARDDDADDDEEKKTRAAREDDARVTSEGSSREEVRESDREHLSEVVVTLAETFPSEATAKSRSPKVPKARKYLLIAVRICVQIGIPFEGLLK